MCARSFSYLVSVLNSFTFHHIAVASFSRNSSKDSALSTFASPALKASGRRECRQRRKSCQLGRCRSLGEFFPLVAGSAFRVGPWGTAKDGCPATASAQHDRVAGESKSIARLIDLQTRSGRELVDAECCPVVRAMTRIPNLSRLRWRHISSPYRRGRCRPSAVSAGRNASSISTAAAPNGVGPNSTLVFIAFP